MFLKRTRAIWKRKMQGALFSVMGMQALLDERERHQLEDSMGFRGQWDEHRRFQIDELKKLGLQPQSRVLEIGCGPLTAGIPVITYLEPDRYVGLDVRSSVLNLAYQQIGRAGLSGKNPRLICTDNFGVVHLMDQKFDFVWSFSVLYHLTDEILEDLMRNVSLRLDIGGRFVANVMTDMENSTWLEFPFLRRSVKEYTDLAARHGLTCSKLGTLAELGLGLSGAESQNELLQFRLTSDVT